MIAVELAVLIVVVAVAVVVFVLAHRQLVGALYDRQKVMDVHQKSVTRHALDVTNRANAVLDDSQRAREDARLTLERVEQHFADPRVKRMLDG